MAAPKAGRFEWIAPWEEVRALLEPSVLGLRPDARALDLGCGTSTLALELSRVPGIGSVVGLDREPGCIEHMRSTHGEPPGVRWVAGDILSPGADAPIPSACLDLIVDKGTLDCALTENAAAALLCAVWRILDAGGVYAIISFREGELLSALLPCDGALPWVPLGPPNEGSAGTVYCVRKGAAPAPPDVPPPIAAAISTHVGATLDWWYREKSPMLTRFRAELTRRAWAERIALERMAAVHVSSAPGSSGQHGGRGGVNGLPLRAAYEVLFTPTERDELDFTDFAEEVAELLARKRDGSGGSDGGAVSRSAVGVAEAPGPERGADLLIGLEEALQYLQDAQ